MSLVFGTGRVIIVQLHLILAKMGKKIIAGIVIVIVVSLGVFWVSKFSKGKLYDVAVSIRDQGSDVDDLQAGDVALVKEAGWNWSNTERISYLLLKMRLDEDRAKMLVEPEIRQLSEEEALAEGLVRDDILVDLKEEDKERLFQATISARKYRIKIEELNFDPTKIIDAQPFPKKEFDWNIVEDKTGATY